MCISFLARAAEISLRITAEERTPEAAGSSLA